MADELQALLNKIDEEGIKKAEAKGATLIGQARLEAEKLLEEARQQADKILANAQREANTLEQNSQQALQQGARDVLLGLRAQLETRVRQAVSGLLKEAFSAEQAGAIIGNLCNAYLQSKGEDVSLTVLLPEAQLATLEQSVKAKLADQLRERCNLAPAKNLSGGFRLLFEADDVVYDFSDEALAEALSAHLSPRIAGILTADK